MCDIYYDYFYQVFTGNTDRYTVVTNNLINPIKAKFIRFYPKAGAYYRWPSMRAEVYGVSAGKQLTSCS
jgi:hypothetical protein